MTNQTKHLKHWHRRATSGAVPLKDFARQVAETGDTKLKALAAGWLKRKGVR